MKQAGKRPVWTRFAGMNKRKNHACILYTFFSIFEKSSENYTNVLFWRYNVVLFSPCANLKRTGCYHLAIEIYRHGKIGKEKGKNYDKFFKFFMFALLVVMSLARP